MDGARWCGVEAAVDLIEAAWGVILNNCKHFPSSGEKFCLELYLTKFCG